MKLSSSSSEDSTVLELQNKGLYKKMGILLWDHTALSRDTRILFIVPPIAEDNVKQNNGSNTDTMANT